MREILFKGKRIDNGEWVYWNIYGMICNKNGKLRRLSVKRNLATTSYYHYIHQIINLIDINTICQYTGLTDKNGNKIWENDIVKGLFYHGLEVKAVVGFKYGAFGLKWNRGDVEEFSPFTSICNCEYEVIGNIFDNPELLKGGSE